MVETGRIHELDVPLDHIPFHVRGSSIIITQKPGVNTLASRKNSFGLIATFPAFIETSLFVSINVSR